jgi:hypothetical protein
MLPADIWPPQSRYRSSRFTRALLRAAVRMKLIFDSNHKHVYEASLKNPPRPFAMGHMVYCRCGEGKIFAR